MNMTQRKTRNENHTVKNTCLHIDYRDTLTGMVCNECGFEIDDEISTNGYVYKPKRI